jgi:hypothetical protein
MSRPLPPWPSGSIPGFGVRWVGRFPVAILTRPIPRRATMSRMKK